jgi:radical SAM superfamily enzyme YgiQ (UPF0313 family)
MKRPVWLFSMDSDQFYAPPTTNGALKAYFLRYGKTSDQTDIRLIHFKDENHIQHWLEKELKELTQEALKAIDRGLQPIAGFSFYTWNAAEFLSLIRRLKSACPGLQVIAGGPHVQQAEDYLHDDPIDVISLGEGEGTFQEFIDCQHQDEWHNIDGLAYLRDNKIITTQDRKRTRDMSVFPSALEVVELCDSEGMPLYQSISYETSRGCPFKCSFCEWGTGDLGSKIYQHSLARIRSDWEKIVASGIKDIWLADSNFGALKEDIKKAHLIVELKEKTGLPTSFATSWSKKHSPRVQEIVLLLHDNGLLPHYQLALQTLTPLALELSNRKNMGSNKYIPIAKEMSVRGVPIAAELIWGLPGDTLASFEHNLDQLLSTFPNINIFGYTLLPGTEFYRRRFEYQLETVPVAGYGKAKGEYVVACHTFNRFQGEEGYFLITAHILLAHGYILPKTIRYLALIGDIPVSALLRQVLKTLLEKFYSQIPNINKQDKISIYENRNDLYLALLTALPTCYELIVSTIEKSLIVRGIKPIIIDNTLKLIDLDHACCPRTGNRHTLVQNFNFDAIAVSKALDAMEIPQQKTFVSQGQSIDIDHPGGVGTLLIDADGGSWMKGKIQDIGSIEVLEFS